MTKMLTDAWNGGADDIPDAFILLALTLAGSSSLSDWRTGSLAESRDAEALTRLDPVPGTRDVVVGGDGRSTLHGGGHEGARRRSGCAAVGSSDSAFAGRVFVALDEYCCQNPVIGLTAGCSPGRQAGVRRVVRGRPGR